MRRVFVGAWGTCALVGGMSIAGVSVAGVSVAGAQELTLEEDPWLDDVRAELAERDEPERDEPERDESERDEPEAPAEGVEPAAASAEEAETRGADVPDADSPTWRTRLRPHVTLNGNFRFRAHRWGRYHVGRDDEPFVRFRRSTEGETPEGGCGGEDACGNGALRFADLRLRLMPTIHVGDYVALHTTVDLFDGQLLGAAPRDGVIPWAQEGTDAITLRHAWAQMRLPSVGELRVGRMPVHFGLGLVQHAGLGIDDDAGSDVDRIEARGRVGPIELRAAWDFASRGDTAGIENSYGDIPFDGSRLDDTRQWTLAAVHEEGPIQGGVQLIGRRQTLERVDGRLVRRNLRVYSPSVWLRVVHRGFRLELEGASHLGSAQSGETSVDLRQGAFALELEQHALERRLRIGIKTVVASGDRQLSFATPDRIDDVGSTASLFVVHPSYRLDEVLWRRLGQSIAGAWVLRPHVAYDVLRDERQQLAVSAAAVYSRRLDARADNPNLGLEMDLGAAYSFSLTAEASLLLRADYSLLVPLPGLGGSGSAHGFRILAGVEF
ncbi:MAG: hypothetical protein AAGE52_08080 [Myxococcota bacterium]